MLFQCLGDRAAGYLGDQGPLEFALDPGSTPRTELSCAMRTMSAADPPS